MQDVILLLMTLPTYNTNECACIASHTFIARLESVCVSQHKNRKVVAVGSPPTKNKGKERRDPRRAEVRSFVFVVAM